MSVRPPDQNRVHAAPRQNGYRRALPLDVKRQRSTKASSSPRFECEDYVRGQRWRLWDGTLLKVRCGKANYCDFCASLAALENARVVALDAAEELPTVGLTTTTRRPGFPLADLRKAEQLLWRQLRREYDGPVRYLGFLEWTTGRSARSGGHRRPHLHHLVKGLPLEEVESGRLEQRVAELWHRFTGDAFVVECRLLRSPAGAISYLALHHNKREQAPPPGFENVKRFRPSKGYFNQPLPELRETARATMKDDRLSWAIARATQTLVEDVDVELDQELELALASALRSLARRPAEAQLTIDGGSNLRDELAELARRAAAFVRRQREAHPPRLVLGIERAEGFIVTGERWWAAA